MPNKVLVTGADGLLGSNLVRELIGQGLAVRVLIHPASKSPTLSGLAIEKITGDLLAENDTLQQAASGCAAIFHCAAITSMWAKPELVFSVNLEGTRKVLEVCLAQKIRKLIFVGSASSFSFGARENPGDEGGAFPAAYNGMPYMESKFQAMNLVKKYVAEKGLDAVIVTPTFMLGRYDPGPSSGELIRQFIKRKMGSVSPGGRNFVHVRDVASAMVAALSRGRKGESYILAGENLTYLEFFGKVAKIAGVPAPRRELPSAVVVLAGLAGSAYGKLSGKPAQLNLKMAQMACLGTYYSPAKARKELGMPATPIEKAIEESLSSLKEYGHI